MNDPTLLIGNKYMIDKVKKGIYTKYVIEEISPASSCLAHDDLASIGFGSKILSKIRLAGQLQDQSQ